MNRTDGPPAERIRGVATPLPPGERVLWQGGPAAAPLARHAFHAWKIALYFGLLLTWRAADAMQRPDGRDYFLAGALPLLLLGVAAVACSFMLSRLTHKQTVYAVTDRRVVMRTGLVLTSTINIPFRQIEGASVRRYADGSGDIAIRLGGTDRLAYLLLWPHARGWRVRRPEPALRSLAEVDAVAKVLHAALLASDAVASDAVASQALAGESLVADGFTAEPPAMPAPVLASPRVKPVRRAEALV